MLSRLTNSFRREPQLALVISIALIIGFLSLSPTLMLFYGSFRSKPLGVPGQFTLAHYIGAYTDPLTYQLLFNSFIFAGGSALLAIGLHLVRFAVEIEQLFFVFFDELCLAPTFFGLLEVRPVDLFFFLPQSSIFSHH